jgi:hypothetical protein
MPQPQSNPRWTFVLSPTFKLVFLCLVGLTVLSLGASLFLVTRAYLSEEAKRLAATCATTWKMGFVAIAGLVGGKTVRSFWDAGGDADTPDDDC